MNPEAMTTPIGTIREDLNKAKDYGLAIEVQLRSNVQWYKDRNRTRLAEDTGRLLSAAEAQSRCIDKSLEALAQLEQPDTAKLSDDDALRIAIEWGSEMAHVRQFMEWAKDRINERVSAKMPVIAHINIDPDASEETMTAVAEIVQAAYDYKPDAAKSAAPVTTKRVTDADLYRMSEQRARDLMDQGCPRHLAEARSIGWRDGMKQAQGYIGGLSVERVMQVVKEWDKRTKYTTDEGAAYKDLTESLTKALNDQ